MSTELVRAELLRFISDPKEGVLCIRGNWGTGKTYTWDETLRIHKEKLALKKYAYVSLFGLNSISQVRLQIFNSTIATTHIGKVISLDDVEASLREGINWSKKLASLAARIFSNEDSVDVALSLVAMSARNQFICFDDLERKGNGLSSQDVLGLISELKERRKCKVVLLLNDEQLEDRDDFETFLEKVVDINLSFRPTAVESATIAVNNVEGDSGLKEIVRERAIVLNIDNVRVIQKIFRLTEIIARQLEGYPVSVLNSVTSALVLFGWSHFQPEIAPSLSYLRNTRSEFGFMRDRDKASDKERAWDTLLDKYGYGYTGEFDTVLIDGVKNGYFPEKAVADHAQELNQREEFDIADREMRDAWELYHYSFTSTAEEVIRTLRDKFVGNIKFYNFSTLITLVNFFRELNYEEVAKEIVDVYIKSKGNIEGAFDYSLLRFHGQEVPEEFLSVFDDIIKAQKPALSFEEMLKKLKNDSYNEEIIIKLGEADVKDYYLAFKSHQGRDELGSIMHGVQQYLRFNDPKQHCQKVLDKAGEALRLIAAESPINERRARDWGLIQRLEQKEAEDAAAAAAIPSVAIEVIDPVKGNEKPRR